jgi:hypothetical protein
MPIPIHASQVENVGRPVEDHGDLTTGHRIGHGFPLHFRISQYESWAIACGLQNAECLSGSWICKKPVLCFREKSPFFPVFFPDPGCRRQVVLAGGLVDDRFIAIARIYAQRRGLCPGSGTTSQALRWS